MKNALRPNIVEYMDGVWYVELNGNYGYYENMTVSKLFKVLEELNENNN